jgi:hypothetical protein
MATRPRPRALHACGVARATASVIALVVVLAGCTAADGRNNPPPRTAPTGAAATTTRAAELRAALTYLLVERTHLLVACARTLDGPPDGCRTALDASTAATADALSAAAPRTRAELVAAVRAHGDRVLDAATALVDGDAAAAQRAVTALPERHAALADVLVRVAPGLPPDDVRATLTAGTDDVLAAVEAVAAGDPASFPLERRASARAADTARLLAVGVAREHELGAAEGPAADLRSGLTAVLTEHVMLSAALARVAPSEQVAAAARAAVTANVAAVADVVSAADPDAGRTVRTIDGGMFSALLTAVERHTGQQPPRTADAVARAERSLRAAVDAASSGQADALVTLRSAAGAVPTAAALLAAAVAEDLRLE